MNHSALAIFKQLPETKSEVENYTKIIKGEVLDGNINPLSFITTVTALEKLFSNLKSDLLIKDAVLEEAEKQCQKSFDYGNAKFQVKEAGVTYDFSVCQDIEWEFYDSEMKRISELKKRRETFLKSLSPEITVFGDGVELLPPEKKSTTIVSVTLK